MLGDIPSIAVGMLTNPSPQAIGRRALLGMRHCSSTSTFSNFTPSPQFGRPGGSNVRLDVTRYSLILVLTLFCSLNAHVICRESFSPRTHLILVKFLSDFDIFRPSTSRCPACRK